MMMDETAESKLIDDYIMNRLNKDQRKSFEVRLDQDPALQEALQIRQIMIEQVKTIGNLQLKDKILNIQKNVEGKEKHIAKRRNIRYFISIAAAMVVLFIGFQWFNTTQSVSNLYANNYEAYDQLRFGNRSTQEDKTLLDVGALYQKGNYAEMLKAIESLAPNEKEDDRIILASAICHMELEHYKKAIGILKQASVQNEFFYQDQAKWYLALNYLKLDQIEKSNKLLQDLSKTSNFYSKKAKDLLEDIK